MSYDLYFWKYKPGVVMDHQSACQRLTDGEQVEGIQQIPIDSITARIKAVFSTGWDQLDSKTYTSNKGAFQLSTSTQFFCAHCNGLPSDDMNRLIEIAAEFGCSLFDPQVGTRYNG